MITRTDCYLLLKDLQDSGIDTSEHLNAISQGKGVVDCLNFINKHRQLDVTAFYKKLRKSYNTKKSKLYGNIVKEERDPLEAPTILSSFLLQVMLFSKQVENKQLFFKHARADEVNKVLSLYFSNYDIVNCVRLLDLIRADLKVVESFYRE